MHRILRDTSGFVLPELQRLVYSSEISISIMTMWSRKDKGKKISMGPSKSSIKRKTLMRHLQLTVVPVLSQRLLIWFPPPHTSKQTVRYTVCWLTKCHLSWTSMLLHIIQIFIKATKPTSLGLLLLHSYLPEKKKKKGKRYNFEKQLNKILLLL